jgi:purine-nucleoside phosphorylase
VNIERLRDAERFVKKRLPGLNPSSALILGSGWSDVVDAFDILDMIPYSEIPGLGETVVAGHAGRMVIADSASGSLLIFQGRRHWYEGVGWEPIALPVYLCARTGVTLLVLTNAAGGISQDIEPGTLMIIDDHINVMGVNPLQGPHDATWGSRFPDMSEVYSVDMRRKLDDAAAELGEPVTHGVYLATHGPTYETPAEINAFRSLGADAVGMSTVPEALLANACGLRVVGISCITNFAAGVSKEPLDHEKVVAATQHAQPRMQALLKRFFSLSLVHQNP